MSSPPTISGVNWLAALRANLYFTSNANLGWNALPARSIRSGRPEASESQTWSEYVPRRAHSQSQFYRAAGPIDSEDGVESPGVIGPSRTIDEW